MKILQLRLNVAGLILVTIAILSMVVQQSIAQEAGDGITRVTDILDAPANYANERHTLFGTISQWEPSDSETTSRYTLSGREGGLITVQTTGSQPETNTNYRVTGTVVLDTDGRPYLIEESRQAPVVQPPPPPKWYETPIGIAGIAAVLVALGLLIFLLARRSGSASGGRTIEVTSNRGEQVRVTAPPAPPPGTLKVLPGRFRLLGGVNGRASEEIRVYQEPGQLEAEVTFGRGTGKKYQHIQLDSQTVSQKQAKVLFSNGQYQLINYSTSNPTTVNGTTLGVNQSAELNDGDRIVMGEVEMEYRSS